MTQSQVQPDDPDTPPCRHVDKESCALDLLSHRGKGQAMFGIVLDWEEFKVWLTATTGLSHHDYHLLLGVLLTLGFGWLLRVPLGSWLPLGIVFVLEMINEAFDFTRYYVDSYPWGPGPMLVDIALTMLPPLAIVLAARWESPFFYRFRRRAPLPIEDRVIGE